MKYIDSLISQLNIQLADSKKDLFPYRNYASTTMEEGNYTIEVWIDSTTVEVIVANKYNFFREYPNIENYITERIHDYDSIDVKDEDIWNCNGFSSEYDYNKWKYN